MWEERFSGRPLTGKTVSDHAVAQPFRTNKGRLYHDGRFATLPDVIEHYNMFLNLKLTDTEKAELVEYLKSL